MLADRAAMVKLQGYRPDRAKHEKETQEMKKARFWTVLVLSCLVTAPSGADEDTRELVKLAPEIKAKFLANMRDHISALDDILADIAWGDLKGALETAETRLGMSSLGIHEASKIGPLLPDPMRLMGKSMHRAASKLVIAVENAEIEDPKATLRSFATALQEVTTQCVACHSSYRIR